jgi:peptide/nickel transport system permease protein
MFSRPSWILAFAPVSEMTKTIRLDPDKMFDFRTISQGERFKIGLLSTWRQMRVSWGIYSRNRLAVLGLVLLLAYVFMASIHPILLRTVWSKTVYDPVVGFDISSTINPAPPSARHPLGTDTLGRDVLSMLMAASAPSLAMAMTAALTAAAIGVLVGAVSAYFRGAVDGIFSHLADLTLLMPAPLVMVIIGFALDIGPFKFGLIYGILVGLGVVAIVLRAHALTVVNKAFIDAARIAGGGSLHIVFKHLVPHLVPLATVNMLLTVTGAIFANGFIAFLGLSRAQLNWGSMIYDSFTYQGINGMIPWNVLVPSATAISLFAASFYMIALGLQDVTNPRLAERLVIRTGHLVEMKVQEASKVSPGSTGRRWITTLFMHLDGCDHETTPDIQVLESGISIDLITRGGWVKQLPDHVWIASYGLEKIIPPQANALMVAITILSIKQGIEDFNRKRIEESREPVKLSAGISLDQVDLPSFEKDGGHEPVLNKKVRLVAQTLCAYANFMRNGGVLICGTTFDNLAAVQHHFIFGRQGMAKLPPGNGQKMVYELVGKFRN